MQIKMAENKNDDDVGLIQIRFVTKQEEFAVPDVPLSVPVTVTTTELNDLVNNILQESDDEKKKVDFEFLIEQELLRTSLQEHLQNKQLSTEQTLEVEYLERLPAPKPQDCLQQDDWVTTLHTKGNLILSGSYDGSSHIWTEKGKDVLNIDNEVGAIKAVAWVSLTEEEAIFIAGGQEQTTVMWHWNRTNNLTSRLALYRGHERSVESLDVSPDGARFASVGWDTMLKVWSLSTSDDNPPPVKKSKKVADKGIPSKAPEMTLKGHRDCVSCVRWRKGSEILTCSWDETIRLWDVEDGGMKQEMTGNKAFQSCDLSLISGLILTSSCDRHVRLYDPRSTEGSVVKQTFSGHQNWVQSVRWSPSESHLFISAGQDHMLMLWDTRSPRAPLYEMAGHSDKVLCCDWSDPSRMVSGGADSAIRIFTAPGY